jgi:hypothetical protein
MCALSNIERKFCNKWKYALIKHDFHILSLSLCEQPQTLRPCKLWIGMLVVVELCARIVWRDTIGQKQPRARCSVYTGGSLLFRSLNSFWLTAEFIWGCTTG